MTSRSYVCTECSNMFQQYEHDETINDDGSTTCPRCDAWVGGPPDQRTT